MSAVNGAFGNEHELEMGNLNIGPSDDRQRAAASTSVMGGSSSRASTSRTSQANDLNISNWTKITDQQNQGAAAAWARKVVAVSAMRGDAAGTSNQGRDRESDRRSGASRVAEKISPPSHFPEEILNREKQKWEDLETRLFKGPAPARGLRYPMVQIRNYVLWANDNVPFWRRRIESVRRPEFLLKSLRIFVGSQSLLHLLDRIQSRIDPFLIKLADKTIEARGEDASEEETDEYLWLADACYEVDQGIEKLDAIVTQIQVLLQEQQSPTSTSQKGQPSVTFKPLPGSVRLGDGSESDGGESIVGGEEHSVSRPATPTVGFSSNTRGVGETSTGRARQWTISSNRRGVPIDQSTQHLGAGDPAMMGARLVSPYKTRIATLGVIAFLGASVAWSSVFSGTRGSIALLAWAAGMFAVAAVAAGGMAIVVDSEYINAERDPVARRAARALGIASGGLIFAGIMLLSVSMLDLAEAKTTLEMTRKTWVKAAAIFTIASSCVVLAISILIRLWCARGQA